MYGFISYGGYVQFVHEAVYSGNLDNSLSHAPSLKDMQGSACTAFSAFQVFLHSSLLRSQALPSQQYPNMIPLTRLRAKESLSSVLEANNLENILIRGKTPSNYLEEKMVISRQKYRPQTGDTRTWREANQPFFEVRARLMDAVRDDPDLPLVLANFMYHKLWHVDSGRTDAPERTPGPSTSARRKRNDARPSPAELAAKARQHRREARGYILSEKRRQTQGKPFYSVTARRIEAHYFRHHRRTHKGDCTTPLEKKCSNGKQ